MGLFESAMRDIGRENYGPATLELLHRAEQDNRPRALVFSTPDAGAEAALKALSDQTISKNRRVRMPHDAAALKAGLWLLFDFMAESHEFSQALATPSGSYWHGILHRREPDAFNAKYWMARVGEHPIFPELLNDARELAVNSIFKDSLQTMKIWDGKWHVDACCGKHDGAEESVLLEIQRREWALLFDYNFGKAFA